MTKAHLRAGTMAVHMLGGAAAVGTVAEQGEQCLPCFHPWASCWCTLVRQFLELSHKTAGQGREGQRRDLGQTKIPQYFWFLSFWV